jgi:hypothetical protein
MGVCASLIAVPNGNLEENKAGRRADARNLSSRQNKKCFTNFWRKQMETYEVRFCYYDKDGELTYHYEPFGEDKDDARDWFSRQTPTKSHPVIQLYGMSEYEENGEWVVDEWCIDEKRL